MREFLINKLAKFLSNYLIGSKSNLLGYIGLVVGFYNLIVELDIIKELCLRFNWCFEGSTVWGAIMTIMSYLILVLRKATEIKHVEEITELRISLFKANSK